MLFTDETKKPVYEMHPYTAPDGTRYPFDYPKDQIKGLVTVTETMPPEGCTKFIIDENNVQVWQTAPQEILDEIEEIKSVKAELEARLALLADSL